MAGIKKKFIKKTLDYMERRTKNMATFNILSSCICRDAFGFQEKCEHEVITFLQSTSALTWFHFDEKPIKPLKMNMFENIDSLSKFQKKCIIKDYNKEVLGSYQKKSDFFIMDLTEFVSANLAEYVEKENEKSHFFSYTKWAATAYDDGIKKFLPNELILHNAVDLLKNEELMIETIDYIKHWLLVEKGYKEDQIILVRDKKVDAYSDSKVLVYFDNKYKRKSINKTLEKVYDCFESKMPKCHVIDMPLGTYSDKYHRWGVTDLHFCKEYYDYLYQCFDLIAKGKENLISKLFYKYSKLLTEKREQLILNSINQVKTDNLLSGNLEDALENYIVEIGTAFYVLQNNEYIKKGITNRCFSIANHAKEFSEFVSNDKVFFAKTSDCKKGYIGHKVEIGNTCWMLQNQSTFVKMKDNGIIIGHNGKKSKAQMQIISTIKNSEQLQGKVVTFSVWARVLKKSSEGKGGCIAFINANNYNKGIFCAKEEFDNSEWKKISVSYWIPQGKDFHGLTVCMRALAGDSIDGGHARVEYRSPIVQVGSFTINML